MTVAPGRRSRCHGNEPDIGCDQSAALTSRKGQHGSIVGAAKFGRVDEGEDIMTALTKLSRDDGRDMLVEQDPHGCGGRPSRMACAAW